MVNLSFSSEAVYPNYWSTMSSIYYASAYTEIWGNPDLKPMSKYDINLMWQRGGLPHPCFGSRKIKDLSP